ncbi:MAG: extracellular solute-binding protein [Oscillospiraceae bacterium]|nr:extracellular solute-binding protein [Oscillospiraceae bacterium]
MTKRLLSLILALVCCLTLLAGCGGGSDEPLSNFNPDLENYVAPDLTGKTIDIYAWENSDFDPQGSWLLPKIEETLGVDLNYVALDSFSQQIATMMSEGKVPDITHSNVYNNSYDAFGDDGAYINIYNYLDYMPNVKAFIEDPENAADVTKYTVREGVMYCLPVHTEDEIDPYIFLYRKDLFEKHELQWPTNQDEFMAVLRKLKEAYPSSYPFVMRAINGNMQSIMGFSHLWGATHLNQGAYNTIFTVNDDGQYYMAQVSDAYKEMAMFLNGLMNEGLMHPSGAMMDAATWYESFASNTSFITFDKTDRLPVMNRTGQSLNPEFQVAAAEPFNFGSYAKTADQVTTSFGEGHGAGTVFWNAIGNNENLENTLAYVDWMYSEPGLLLTNWGIEGESFEIDENGEKKFLKSFLDEEISLTIAGLRQPGLCGVRMTEPWMKSLSEEDAASLELALKYVGGDTPQYRLRYDDEEQLVYDTYALSCFNYAQTQWSKFLLNQRDFSEWDKVLEEMKAKYHYDDLMDVHESALARLKEEIGE